MKPEAASIRQSNRYDAVLEAQGRLAYRVVFQVELLRPDLFRETRSLEQRRKPGRDRWFVIRRQWQQIAVTPHAGWAPRNPLTGKLGARGFVIVENFQWREAIV